MTKNTAPSAPSVAPSAPSVDDLQIEIGRLQAEIKKLTDRVSELESLDPLADHLMIHEKLKVPQRELHLERLSREVALLVDRMDGKQVERVWWATLRVRTGAAWEVLRDSGYMGGMAGAWNMPIVNDSGVAVSMSMLDRVNLLENDPKFADAANTIIDKLEELAKPGKKGNLSPLQGLNGFMALLPIAYAAMLDRKDVGTIRVGITHRRLNKRGVMAALAMLTPGYVRK